MVKYKISNYKELNDTRTNLNGELKDLIRQRNNLYYKRKNILGLENKNDISKDIEVVTEKIVKARNEIRLCNDIEVKSKKIWE